MTGFRGLDRKVRVGAVSYLNTRPLIHRFAEFAPDAALVLDVPSRLAALLSAGELDVALVPSIEAFRGHGYRVVSDACIACRGPVLSVKLLSRVPISEIKTLALDTGSRTSAALVRILLRARFDVSPDVCSLHVSDEAFESGGGADAMLVIGDRAIHASRRVYSDQLDLGEEWWGWTGLPFVFAMWMARRGIDAKGVAAALMRARDAGVAALDAIASSAAPDVGIDEGTCLSYLRDNLHFTLGAEERKGLRLFHRHAARHGFVPAEYDPRTIGLIES